MSGAVLHRKGFAGAAGGITVCPNTVLSVLILTSLVFASYLGRNGVLVFLIAGLVLLARRPDRSRDELRDYWWLYLLPLWCALSMLWSDHPDLSLRHGTQLVITFVIAVTLASRLSPLVFLRVLFLALLVAGLASLLIGNVREDGIWIGIFESKNYYAFTMVALVLCSFALLADRIQPLLWRLAGLFGALLGLPQIMMAESAGAVIASVFVLAAALVMLRTHSLPPARRTAGLLKFCGAALAMLLVALYFGDAILQFVVEVTGKDPSLTGRTDLWAAAIGEIGHAPLLGTGYRAFWVEGNSLAEQLWADFYIASKSGFNFHNLYLSNAVDIGLIGVFLHLMLLLPAFLLCTRWVMHAGGAPALFCFMAVAFVLVLSMVEVPVFFEFNALTLMVLASLVYGLRASRELPQLQRHGGARRRV
ncbi:O-antigen ligase family protein [Tabrizicola sp.]|uniref:O-antigen ligase family protein n=1 Tax=Tabrizicola sp. TaxID=2005166 RepID=UPI0026182319|nr:O-antigen ligase family protein [Tabrizicola sp.]MDM7932748.1 O-antigen ligase family protein [Tabrizicola sp.]